MRPRVRVGPKPRVQVLHRICVVLEQSAKHVLRIAGLVAPRIHVIYITTDSSPEGDVNTVADLALIFTRALIKKMDSMRTNKT